MKRTVEKILCAASLAAFTIAVSGTSWAAPDLMPWDRPLNAVVTYLTDDATPAVVTLALGGAAILFAVNGTSASTRQLTRLGLGAGLGLMAVRLLNYLLP
jgi:type IV secretory pathway VirB2 component (pilin)